MYAVTWVKAGSLRFARGRPRLCTFTLSDFCVSGLSTTPTGFVFRSTSNLLTAAPPCLPRCNLASQAQPEDHQFHSPIRRLARLFEMPPAAEYLLETAVFPALQALPVPLPHRAMGAAESRSAEPESDQLPSRA